MKTNDLGFKVNLFSRSRTPTPQHQEARAAVRCSKPDVDVMQHVIITEPDGRDVRHRIMLDENHHGSWTYTAIMNGQTSCEIAIATSYARPVDASYEGELCKDGCFSPAELRKAIVLHATAEQRRQDKAAREDQEREKDHERFFKTMREDVRLAKTGEMPPLKKPEPEEK